LSVHALEQHGLKPGNGPVLVTGATGGVGSVAVEILGRLGYEVVAATGKAEQADWLRSLGASDVIGRDVVMAESTRPLESERWAGVVDPVGGAATAYAIRTTKYFGGIALSGNTGGRDVSTTVLPFILRGVALLGIDSVMCPRELRSSIWQRLGADLKPEKLLGSKIEEIGLDGVIEAGERIRGGQVAGRILVRLDA
jgi:putative YhdH/YhfP family quinone oxidoreductase